GSAGPILWTTSTPSNATPSKRGRIRPNGFHGTTNRPCRLPTRVEDRRAPYLLCPQTDRRSDTALTCQRDFYRLRTLTEATRHRVSPYRTESKTVARGGEGQTRHPHV